MTALHHDKGRTQAASRGKLALGLAEPASIACRDQSNSSLLTGVHSSVRVPTCRGFGSGFFIRIARGVSSSLAIGHRRAGFGLIPSGRPVTHSRVGWCFNTARDFLEFHALTRAGIRPDHAVALLSFNVGHHVLQDTADVPECHVDRLSRVAGFDDQQRREAETQNVGTVFQRAQ